MKKTLYLGSIISIGVIAITSVASATIYNPGSSGASLSGGTADSLTYWTSATTVGATSSPTVGTLYATSSISVPLGTLANPSILIRQVGGAGATGIYSDGVYFFNIGVNGQEAFTTNAYGYTGFGNKNLISFVNASVNATGGVTTPVYTFQSAQQTGLYLPSATSLGITVAGANALVFASSSAAAFGSSTPTANLQVTTPLANATSTLEIGKSGQNKGSCLIMYNEAGTVQYVSIVGSNLTVSATSCR